jgi:hypothetical protein
MCRPVSHQRRFSLIFFVQQEPEPEPRARKRLRFRFFLGQNDTVPVPQHCIEVYQFPCQTVTGGLFLQRWENWLHLEMWKNFRQCSEWATLSTICIWGPVIINIYKQSFLAWNDSIQVFKEQVSFQFINKNQRFNAKRGLSNGTYFKTSVSFRWIITLTLRPLKIMP